MAKEFAFYGKTLADLKTMSLSEFVKLLPARKRRSITRGFTEQQKILLNKIKMIKQTGSKKVLKTHIRDMIVTPEMIGLTVNIHIGKDFTPVIITKEMLGCYLGELTLTRKKVQHSAPGVGATKSSAAISVR